MSFNKFSTSAGRAPAKNVSGPNPQPAAKATPPAGQAAGQAATQPAQKPAAKA